LRSATPLLRLALVIPASCASTPLSRTNGDSVRANYDFLLPRW
jgi:hypothetical protein